MYLEPYNPIKQHNEDVGVQYKTQYSFSFRPGAGVKCVLSGCVCVCVCVCVFVFVCLCVCVCLCQATG
jgi:hypothetical protein